MVLNIMYCLPYYIVIGAIVKHFLKLNASG
jgi:hypothetical protein